MRRYTGLIYLLLVLVLTGFMIINPSLTIKSSLDGLDLWFRIVLPALFPFFVVAELLVQLGFVHFLGTLLEPIMRPLFRLPGASSFVVAMGFTSGFPIGAVLTHRLYEEKLLDAKEAERLVSFTNNASPLFMLGAVAVGMFNMPAVGYIIAGSHYLANLSVGLLWGRLAPARYGALPVLRQSKLLPTALGTLWKYHSQQPPAIGRILGDSIRNSINSIMAVGGFIIVFSVITQMLCAWGFLDLLARGIQAIAMGLHPSYSLAYGLSMGIFEMTLGARAVAAADAGLTHQLVAVSLVMAWSGLSIIAQVMSIISGTSVRFSFYILSRIMQMILSSFYTLIGCRLILDGKLAQASSISFALTETVNLVPLLQLCAVPLLLALLALFLLILLGLALHKLNTVIK